jgi:hypothetical protein
MVGEQHAWVKCLTVSFAIRVATNIVVAGLLTEPRMLEYLLGDELIQTPIIFDCTNKRTLIKHVARLNRQRFSQSHAAIATTRYIARRFAVFTWKPASFAEAGKLAR